METLQDLFLETLKDIYYAEKAILKALPKMSKKAVFVTGSPRSGSDRQFQRSDVA